MRSHCIWHWTIWDQNTHYKSERKNTNDYLSILNKNYLKVITDNKTKFCRYRKSFNLKCFLNVNSIVYILDQFTLPLYIALEAGLFIDQILLCYLFILQKCIPISSTAFKGTTYFSLHSHVLQRSRSKCTYSVS